MATGGGDQAEVQKELAALAAAGGDEASALVALLQEAVARGLGPQAKDVNHMVKAVKKKKHPPSCVASRGCFPSFRRCNCRAVPI